MEHYPALFRPHYFKLIPKYIRLLISLLEYYIWVKINKLQKVKLISSNNNDFKSHILIAFSYKAATGNFKLRRAFLNKFSAVYFHLSHYFVSTSEKSDNLKTISNVWLAGDSDLSDNDYYNAYFHWYKNGILYCKFDVKNKDESLKGLIKGYALFYHRIGTNQKDDILIYKPESEYSILDFNISEQKGYAIIKREFMNSGKKYYAISFSNLKDSLKFNFKDFIITTKEDLYFDVIGKLNGKFLVQTNYFAPNGAIYKYDPVGINRAEKFIPEYADQLQYSKIMGNKIISAYSTDSVSFGVIKDSTGKFLNIWRIPEGHSFTEFSGEENDSILIFGFHSFFSPATIYQMNVNTLEKKPLSSTLINFDINGLITRRVYYKSKDSTVIPMYLTYKNGIKLNGKNPVILYGYGGFGVSMEPFFSPANIIFFRNGGILATPCLRGGGDYPGWHEKGMRLNKQNTFDDFIAAAEFLISKKYTSSEKLAAMGGSNGGLLVGATMLQRPDLFKVVVSESGAFDMLRYHLYNIGYYYKDEFGNITDSLDFRNLRKYSPVQNVKSDVNYPATLLVASDNDDRVSPFHSFKFMAALQANGTTINPDVIYYEKNAGHSGSDAIEKRIETQAYIYAFIFKYLGIENKITYNSTGW